MRHIFIASISHGNPMLSKFEVAKETAKLLKLGKETRILGGGRWLRQINKTDTYFDNAIDAVVFLITHQCEYITKAEEKLESASNYLSTLKALLAELRCSEIAESRKEEKNELDRRA